MKALDKIREIYNILDSTGIEGADREAELIIMHALNIERADLYKDDRELGAGQIGAVEEMVGRRLRREPLQYIIGSVDFMGLRIRVGQGVLIPRPETELMAEKAVKTITNYELRITNEKKTDILDLCTGSGCLALALAKAFPDAHVFGTDISDAAIEYARGNAAANKLHNVTFIQGHLFAPLGGGQTFDMIISNPPYIKSKDIETLQPEIREWEPRGALDGGRDGIDFYREIIPAARTFLKDNGILMLELGEGASGDVAAMLSDAGYIETVITKDYSGIERIAEGIWTR